MSPRRALLSPPLAAALALAAVVARAAPADDPVLARVAAVVRERCPEAGVELDGRRLVARQDTMTFTLHRADMRGRYAAEPSREEGPNATGFLLTIERADGDGRGFQAVVPQTLDGPYFPTFIDRAATSDGKGVYLVTFSFGRQLDPGLSAAIRSVLPASRPSR